MVHGLNLFVNLHKTLFTLVFSLKWEICFDKKSSISLGLVLVVTSAFVSYTDVTGKAIHNGSACWGLLKSQRDESFYPTWVFHKVACSLPQCGAPSPLPFLAGSCCCSRKRAECPVGSWLCRCSLLPFSGGNGLLVKMNMLLWENCFCSTSLSLSPSNPTPAVGFVLLATISLTQTMGSDLHGLLSLPVCFQ